MNPFGRCVVTGAAYLLLSALVYFIASFVFGGALHVTEELFALGDFGIVIRVILLIITLLVCSFATFISPLIPAWYVWEWSGREERL